MTDFDSLWNFSKPTETEIAFRKVLADMNGKWALDLELQILTQIARTQGLQRKFDDAHQTLDGVKTRLNGETGTAEVRYFLERGRVFNSSKRAPEGLPLFVKAFELAVSRKLENLAVDAAHMVAIAESSAEKQIEWNLRAMKTAEAATEPKAKKWLGSLYNNMGWTFHESGRFDEALGMFQKALQFHQNGGKPENVAIAHWCIGRALRSLKRFDDALKIQLSLEEAAKTAGREPDMYVAEELGELHLVKNEQGKARKYFQRAYDLLSKDEWFKANEAARLERIKQLSEEKSG
ncbi:MAG: tetratricopeptide repeat protein [Bdellovibrionia bacterium]